MGIRWRYNHPGGRSPAGSGPTDELGQVEAPAGDVRSQSCLPGGSGCGLKSSAAAGAARPTPTAAAAAEISSRQPRRRVALMRVSLRDANGWHLRCGLTIGSRTAMPQKVRSKFRKLPKPGNMLGNTCERAAGEQPDETVSFHRRTAGACRRWLANPTSHTAGAVADAGVSNSLIPGKRAVQGRNLRHSRFTDSGEVAM